MGIRVPKESTIFGCMCAFSVFEVKKEIAIFRGSCVQQFCLCLIMWALYFFICRNILWHETMWNYLICLRTVHQ